MTQQFMSLPIDLTQLGVIDPLCSGWKVPSANPVIAPTGKRAYYAGLLYSGKLMKFKRPADGLPYQFYCLFATASGGPCEAFWSNDFVTWVGPDALTSGGGPFPNEYHATVVYVPTESKPFKMWIWIGTTGWNSGPLGTMPIVFRESSNGIDWTVSTPIDEAVPGEFIIPGFNASGTYGITFIKYNPLATNVGEDARNYKYWGHLNVLYPVTGGEGTHPIFSTNGINWKSKYPFIVDTMFNGSQVMAGVLDALPSWSCFSYIQKTDDYLCIYSGGQPAVATRGLFCARSKDGIKYTRTGLISQFGYGGADHWTAGAPSIDASDPIIRPLALYGNGSPKFVIDESGFENLHSDLTGSTILMIWHVQPTSSSNSRKGVVAGNTI